MMIFFYKIWGSAMVGGTAVTSLEGWSIAAGFFAFSATLSILTIIASDW